MFLQSFNIRLCKRNFFISHDVVITSIGMNNLILIRILNLKMVFKNN